MTSPNTTSTSGKGKIAQPRPASEPKPPAPPLINPTGHAKVDAMVDVVNNVAAPFQNAPDPKKGTLGAIEHGIGAVMGVVGAPFELLDTGFAMITAPLAALVPGFPAATLTAPHLGTPHAHSHPPSLIPPAPPVPLPSIGTVMCAGCVSVLIGGMPAARASDIGLAPVCFSFAPAFEIYTGSSNTFFGGSRAARMMDITRHCNPASVMGAMGKAMGAIGVVAGAVGAGAEAAAGQAMAAAMKAAQAAADAVALAMGALLGKDPGIPPAMGAVMLGNPTVLVGGFPMPDVLELLGGIAKGIKKLGKAAAASPKVKKAFAKVGLCYSPGEPVSPLTGEVFNDFDDYIASDSGFRWERHYRSGWNAADGPLGFGFRHFYDRRLTLLRKRAVYETHDGELVDIRRLDDGGFAEHAGFELRTQDGQRFTLLTDRSEQLVFQLRATTPPTARLERYTTANADIHLFYDQRDRLAAFSELVPTGVIDTHITYDESDHIVELRRGPRGSAQNTISRYGYVDGCLVAWQDVLGAVARFRYDHQHRMVQGTDRRGYSFHWQYDVNGRCIKAYGDDGLWSIQASYQGTQSTFKEPDGGEWTYKHFPDGSISHIAGPDGRILSYVKDDSGQVVKQIMPDGNEYIWLYDAKGRHYGRRDRWGYVFPPENDDPSPANPLAHHGPITSREFLCGRPIALLPVFPQALPAPVEYALQAMCAHASAAPTPKPLRIDLMGRVLEQAEADGSIRRFHYDAEGNRIAEQDSASGWSQRQITSWNLVAAEVSPLGNATWYEYSHRGKWRAVIDPNGNRTEYVRDQRHRIHEIRRYGQVYRRYLYDGFDSVAEEQDGNGSTLVKHEIGPHGLHISTTLASGEVYSYDYDARGEFTTASSTRHEVKQRYNERRLELDTRDGIGVEHQYDHRARIRKTTIFGRFHIEYAYMDGRVRITTPDGTTQKLWRKDHLIVRENGNGTSEVSAFDAEGRLTARACWRKDRGEGPFWTTAYRYSAQDELLTSIDNVDGPQQNTYDADHRLIAQQDQYGQRSYVYDPAGNLRATPRYRVIGYGADNLITHADFERFEHDERRRIARRETIHGAPANAHVSAATSGDRSVHYYYDSQDQLIEVRFSDRAETWTAAYDGLSRRLWREYGGRRTEFYWDGDRLAAERFHDGRLRIYVYANEDALVPLLWLDYESEHADPASGKVFYLYCAPTGIPLRVEDATGRETWRAKQLDPYGAFGLPESELPPTRLRFAGHFYDEHLDLFYNRFRDYDPWLGRYLQPDPLGHAGGINLFAYPSNPLTQVDLRGLIHRKKTDAGTDGGQNGKKRPSEEEPKFKDKSDDGDPINPNTGLTKKQEADFRKRIDNAPDDESANNVRYERHQQRCKNRNPPTEPMPRSNAKPPDPYDDGSWDKSNATIDSNSKRGRQHEDAALDDLGVENNNRPRDGKPVEYDHESGEGKTRPDGVTGTSVVDVKSVPPGKDPDGQPRTVYQTDQLRSQKNGAKGDGKQHVTVISSDGPAADTRPSNVLGDPDKGGSDVVLHRNNADNGKMSIWDPQEGAWQDITKDEAQRLVRGKPSS